MTRPAARAARIVLVATTIGAIPLSAQPQVDQDILGQIAAAAPSAAPAGPAKARKLLVFTKTAGFRHDSIPVGVAALRILGEKSRAYEATHSEDVEVFFDKNKLDAFDAVCMLNTTGELFPFELKDDTRPQSTFYFEECRRNLLAFVERGQGLVGIHAATDTCYTWPEYGRMIGGYFDGHPWHERVTLRNEDPTHPLNAPFDGRDVVITDEIYQLRAPWSRGRMRVLLSLDTRRTPMSREGIHRADGDFAVSWIRRQGEGRVFYCSLGHRDEICWNPAVLRHYLAGIQFALGDLPADTTPRGRAGQEPTWKPLFNGRDLSGWKGLVADPAARARLSADELAAAQQAADENMRAHWSVRDGALEFDGKGSHLCASDDYGDFELLVDWKIGPGGDSGVYLRGSPQVQIWDPAKWPEGSGGLYNNQRNPSKPLVRADRPIGAWNEFHIRMIRDRVSVWLNGTLVVDDTPLENYWERLSPIYPTGQIELQSHGSPLYFRNIVLREIPAHEAAAALAAPTWRELFNGRDLTGWQCPQGSWAAEDGELRLKGGGYVWTEDVFGDFTLEFEFKLPPKGNSGLFFRTADLSDPVQTGIELQLYDTSGKEPIGRGDCGAIYDCMAPRVQAVRPAGAWNHATLRCSGARIWASMNGEAILDLDLDQWTEAGQNPDGSTNKFRTPYKDMPRAGRLGFQDHGDPVALRNIRIKPSETVVAGRTVEAGCSLCVFHMPGESNCRLAVRIDGRPLLVEGSSIDDHGDAHAAEGLCSQVRAAVVDGRIRDGRFVASRIECR